MKSILFGDDDEDFRKSYKRLLTLKKFEIDEVSNTHNLIEKARNGSYNLIITDNDYEDKVGGIEAIKMIREIDKETHILLQTTSLTPEVRASALEAGANYVLNKNDLPSLMEILINLK